MLDFKELDVLRGLCTILSRQQTTKLLISLHTKQMHCRLKIDVAFAIPKCKRHVFS